MSDQSPAVLLTGGGQLFYCPSMGEFTVTLTATDDGDQKQARHTIKCV